MNLHHLTVFTQPALPSSSHRGRIPVFSFPAWPNALCSGELHSYPCYVQKILKVQFHYQKKKNSQTCCKIAWVHATYRSLNFLQMIMQAIQSPPSISPSSLWSPSSSSPSAGPRVCCMYSLASRVLAASENLQGQHHTLTAHPETLPWHVQNLQDLSSGDKLWNPNSFSLLLLCM